MPKLSDNLNDRVRGAIALVRLYREDPSFEKELNDVCKPYHSLFQQFALEFLDSHRDAIDLQDDDYQSLVSNLKEQIGGQAADVNKIQACFHVLDELAHHWKLTVPMSGLFLFLSRVTDEVQFLEIKMRTTPTFHPRLSVDISPLELGAVPAWLMTEMSKTELIGLIGVLISEYTDNLKKKGLKARPSKLEKHAYWWFQYKVKKKGWKTLADEEAELDEGGGPHPENIQKAVTRFAKIIGINYK